jgi:hypothetical protein
LAPSLLRLAGVVPRAPVLRGIHDNDAFGAMRLDVLTSKLAVIADWHDELRRKLDRASLRFEFCSTSRPEAEPPFE